MLFLYILDILFRVYSFLLLVRILSSWIPESREYTVMQWIGEVTDPYLNLFRQLIPPLGMMDFSPIVAFLALSMVQNIIFSLLGR